MKNSVFLDLDQIDPTQPVLIAGCTASGKSALALEIAQAQGGVIVNADALQVYENWNVLTARPPQKDLDLADHRLYGHVPFDRAYTVGDWLRDIAPLIHGPDRLIIVGGTGLFFRALTEGLVDIPAIPEEIQSESRGLPLQTLIDQLDLTTRAKIDLANPVRVQRAWAVQSATGRSILDWHAETPAPLMPLSNCAALHLDADPAWLLPRISQRFDIMIKTGAMEEAKANHTIWDPTLLSSKAIGAPELIEYLGGQISLDQAREKAIIATRQYAKRQRTWFRKRMRDWHVVTPRI